MSAVEYRKIVEQMAVELQEEVIRLRRTIHQFPELSFEEYRTSEFIYCTLQCIPGLILTRPTPTSVVAVLKGGREGKTLAIRSDIDALAIQEENKIDYCSRHKGIMHACGHDGHTAMLIGAIKILAAFQAELKGEIRFIFQHAEERHPGGARELISQGVLTGVDMIIALHLWASIPIGKIGISAGLVMAAPDNFDLVVTGKGGHAAMPHEAVDPIAVSAQIINGLQSIVSRYNNPLDPLVLSVTGINGGTAYNILPDKVEMKGTVRTFKPETRNLIPELMERTIQGICSAYGAGYSFNYELGYDPVYNDQEIINEIIIGLQENIGQDSLEKMTPVMGGEDFSNYLRHVPGALVFIGAGNKNEGIIHPHHHACFNIDETALFVGMKVLVYSALRLLKVTEIAQDISS